MGIKKAPSPNINEIGIIYPQYGDNNFDIVPIFTYNIPNWNNMKGE